MDASGAAEELSTASVYQRKAGRRAACLMLILAVVVVMVLIAVSGSLSRYFSRAHERFELPDPILGFTFSLSWS